MNNRIFSLMERKTGFSFHLFSSLFLPLFLVIACLLSACGTGGQASGAYGQYGQYGATPIENPEARKRAQLRLELATNYFKNGQAEVALEELRQVLAIDPTFSEPHNLFGLIYMQLNDFRLSEEAFKRALSLNQRDPNVLHNYGWLLCSQKRYTEAAQIFAQALTVPNYNEKSRTYMTQGLCQARDNRKEEAEKSLTKAYELDPNNPIITYNLALLLFQKSDMTRSQFYIRRLNNSEYANAESLWLGIRVERRLHNRLALSQLAEQLKKRFPQSKEFDLFEKGAFDE